MEGLIPLALVGAVVFYQLRRTSTNTLLAMVVMAILGGVAGYFVYKRYQASAASTRQSNIQLKEDTKGREEIVSSSYEVSAFKKFKHLPRNGVLMDMAKDLRFTRVFDKARYGDLLVHMDKLQKVYMYVLAGRYRPEKYIPTFVDLRDTVLEVLYSYILVVPEVLQHTYGLKPYEVIHKNIDDFTALSRKMMGILQAYAKDKGYTVPDTYFRPYEPKREHTLP
jgi:hypothetical protein